MGWWVEEEKEFEKSGFIAVGPTAGLATLAGFRTDPPHNGQMNPIFGFSEANF